MKRYLKTPEEVIDALQAGKKIEAGDFEYRLVGEVFIAINKTDKSWAVNAGIYSDDIPFIDEPDPLKLEVGKFYKTRDGRKAFVYTKTDEGKYNCWVVIVNSDVGGTFCCTANGEYTANKESEKDLVEPWEE